MKTDLTKADQKVTLQSVWVALASTGTPTPLLKANLRCAVERSVRFSAPGMPTTEAVHLDRGLPQGCPASPVIFTVVLEEVLRDLTRSWDARGMGLYLDGERSALLALAVGVYLLADTAEMASVTLDIAGDLAKGFHG